MKNYIKQKYTIVTLVIALFFISLSCAKGQQLSLLKAERFGETGWDFVNDISRMQNGDYLYCGSISGDMPGDTIGLLAGNSINAWIAFTDSLGNLRIQKEYNSKGFDTFTSMAVLGNNIILSGIFQDTVAFDSIVLSSKSRTNGFLAIANSEGDILDARLIASSESYISNAKLAGCNSGKYFLAGVYRDTIKINDCWSPGASGFFLSQLNPGLEVQTPVFFKAKDNFFLADLSCNDSSVVVTGTFSDTLTILDTNLVALGNKDAFIAKFNHNFKLQQLQLISSPDEAEVKAVVLTSNNQIGIVGSFKGCVFLADSLITGEGNYDIMVAVWDSSGKLQWVNTAGSLGNDFGWAIAPGNDGDFFISGSYTHVLTIPDENGQMVELQPESFFGNTFIAKYDANGILKATFNLPGSSEDFISELLTNKDNTFVASGNFFETLLLTAHDSISYTIESAGSKDIFTLLFMDMCASYTIDVGPSVYICPGETVTLEPEFSCNGYLWLPDGTINTPLEVSQPGAYTLMAMSPYGCIAYDTLLIETTPAPEVYAGNDTLVQPGSSLGLSGSMPMGINPHWTSSGEGYFSPNTGLETTYYFSDSDISNGNLWLILTAENECGSVSDSLHVEILFDDDGITAFPNPTNGSIKIVREETQQMQHITITKQTGYVLEQNIPVDSFEFSYSLQNQPPGTYLFYITTDTGTSCKVVIKL